LKDIILVLFAGRGPALVRTVRRDESLPQPLRVLCPGHHIIVLGLPQFPNPLLGGQRYKDLLVIIVNPGGTFPLLIIILAVFMSSTLLDQAVLYRKMYFGMISDNLSH
jgi:hypothetical protein